MCKVLSPSLFSSLQNVGSIGGGGYEEGGGAPTAISLSMEQQ